MPTPHTHESSRHNVRPVQGLVLIDLQRDFFEDSELARCRADVVEACNRLIANAERAGALVAVVRTVHASDRSTWALNMLDDDQGMAFDGSDGAELVDGLRAERAVDIVKTRDSAFFETDLGDVLRAHGISTFALAGVSTESCVAATATDAYARDYRVAIVDRATASVDEDMHEHILRLLSWQYRQPILEPDEVVFEAATP